MKNRIVKVVTWRIVSIIITMSVMMMFTGDLKSATSLTFFLHALLTVANYGFETLWEKINETR